MFLRDTRLLSAMALTVFVALAIAGCKKAAPGESNDEDKLPKEPVPVRAVKVGRTTLKPSIDLVGTLVAIPEKSASISPQIAGWIQKITIVEGGPVRAGDELLHLDSRLAEADHAKATASVDEKAAILQRLKHGPRPEEIEVARHDAHKARVTMEALRGEMEALKSLQARNEVSPVQFQKVQSSLQAAEAESAAAAAKLKLLEAGTRPEEIAEAEARLSAAKAELATATLNLQLCKIASPIDGIITQLAARQGMYVERTATLATIVDLSKVFMQVRIPSAYLAKVKPGAKVDVRVASLADRTYHGTIARIGGQADPATGDVDALAEVTNEDGLLRPGLACRGRVWLPEIADALVVPVAAVADRSGTPVVSVVRDGKGFEIEVKLGVQTREETQVIEGLTYGDTVITEGGYGLPEGCPVRPLEDADKPSSVSPKR
jgi:multidrug efflux pump subunit AcrA (membrane-fusion protein)